MVRATKKQIHERYCAIYAFCKEHQPVTVRGVYYNLTTRGLIEKTENGYKKVARDCKKMRMMDVLPWHWIADNTRWMRKPTAFGSLEEALENTATHYRRDFLRSAGLDIEVWVEKDALAGIFLDVTSKWDVPLMVSRGFASLSFLQSAAQDLTDGAHIYIFSDYDYAGVHLYKCIEDGLRQFSQKEIHVHRAMLSKEQVTEWSLPTRDPKANDVRNGFEYCCELDAVPPNLLRAEIEACILNHTNPQSLQYLREIEASERESITEIFSYKNV